MRTRTLLAGLAVAAVGPACDSVPLLAPTQSTVRLVVADASIPNGGSTTVTAAVTEAAGTPVHDGTVVTFSTTLGVVDPPEAPTVRGRASATFTAGPRSGTAEVLAYSGDAVSELVEVTIGAAAVATVQVTARPGSLPPTGGTAAVVATVLDAAQNRLPNVRVAFAATAGALRTRVATTDPSGEARTALTTTTAAEVTASVGEVSGTTSVAVDAPTAISIIAEPARPVAGQVVSFEVTLSNEARAIRGATIDFGDGRSHALGAPARATVGHAYAAAGAYTVRVTATDVAGQVAAASIVVHVDPAPGIPVTVAATPADPVAGQAVTFTVELSLPENAPAVREVTIDFGDDSRESLGARSNRMSAVHVYSRAASYVVTVTVSDAADRRHASSTVVTVRSPPAIPVTVTASPSEPVAGQAVTFTVEVSPPAGAPEVREVTIDFGDGSRASLGALTGRRSLVHVYDAAGSYTVTVTVRDAAGRRHGSSTAVEVRSAPGIPVTVTASPPEPVAGQAVTFTVEVSPPAGAPEVREVTVDFGDDSTASLGAVTGRRSLVHVYDAAGSYTVTVTVRDAAGRRHGSSTAVEVRSAPGIPVTVTASPPEPVAGQAVTFTVEVSPPAGAPEVREVTVDFGDDSTASLGAVTGRRSLVHVYDAAGSYTVTVTVRDAAGRRHGSSTAVEVRSAPGIPVTVTASPPEPVAGQAVTFTVEVSPPAGAPEVREVTVDFGDDSTASLGAVTGRRSLVHVYDAAGSYTVTVTVRDAAGRRHGSSTAVEVRSAPGIPVTVTASPPEPVAGQAVTFTVEVSPPAGAPEVREVTVDFGDDSTASLGAVTGRRSLVHVYDAAGSYTVTVTVRDAAGRRHGSSTAVEVRSAPGIPVTVTASPPEPVAGQAVTFTVEVSPPAGAPEIREVTVDFGDSSRASLGALTGRRSLVHVYDAAGSYVVTVTVRDAAERRHESSIAVQVRPAPAISVTVAAVPVSPVAGQPVTFTVQVSPPAGAPEVREVTVDFGDDSTASLGALTGRRSLVHVYDAAGSYVATATVQDAAGRRHRSSIAVVVRVLPAIPVRVTPPPADPVVGDRVTFTVDVSPAPEAPAVRSVTIDFGDGSASRALGAWTGRRFEDHIYATPGRYTVTATVRDAAGRVHAASTVVNVAPKPEELR